MGIPIIRMRVCGEQQSPVVKEYDSSPLAVGGWRLGLQAHVCRHVVIVVSPVFIPRLVSLFSWSFPTVPRAALVITLRGRWVTLLGEGEAQTHWGQGLVVC